MKKITIFSFLFFINYFIFSQQRIDIRPNFNLEQPFSHYLSKTSVFFNNNQLNLLPNIGFFVDIHLSDRYIISTGFAGTTIGTSYATQKTLSSQFHVHNSSNLFQIPLQISYLYKKKYLNWGRLFKSLNLEVLGSLNLSLMDRRTDWNAGSFSINNFTPTENTLVLSQSSLSTSLGLGFQFYGEKKPTFRLELFYRQGFQKMLETSINIPSGNAIIVSRGSSIGINLSYPMTIWRENSKRNRFIDTLSKSEIAIYLRPVINLQTNLAYVTQNTTNYENSSDNSNIGFGFFVDYHLSKRWNFSVGFLKNKIATPYFFYNEERQIGREISTNLFQIPIIATLKTNKIYLNMGNFLNNLSINFSGGLSVDFLGEKNNTLIEKSNIYTINNIVKEKQTMKIVNAQNIAALGGVGFQFYGKKNPTLKIELLYKKGFVDILETNVSSEVLGNTFNGTINSKGNGFILNLSYPFKLWEKKKKANQ